MELALSIALLTGIVLFVLGLLITALAGFKHHFFTGVLALIPFVNFIILPTVWDRVRIGFYLGFVGVLLAVGSWYAGGNHHLVQEAQKLGVNLPSKSTSGVRGSDQGKSQNNTSAAPKKAKVEETPAYVPTGDLFELPKQALYKMGFKTIANNNTADLTGEYVRIKQKRGGVNEGKVSKSNSSSIFIELVKDSGTVAFEIKADNIETLEKLVKFPK